MQLPAGTRHGARVPELSTGGRGIGSIGGYPRLRALHQAEARVTQALLAGELATEVSSGLARRTRQTVLRRLEGWGWFADRLVPHPACLDAHQLAFIVARPFAERATALESRWAKSRETVVAWRVDGAVFGVFAASEPELDDPVGPRMVPPSEGRVDLAMTTALLPSELPVYFDFEAAWVRIAPLEGVRAYPQGFAGPAGDLPPAVHVPDARERAHRYLSSIVARGIADTVPTALDAAVRDPRDEVQTSRLLRDGWVHRRRFLDPSAVARTLTTFPRQVVLVWGRPSEGAADPDLFPALMSEAQVAPFLLAIAPDAVLAGFLADAVGRSGEPRRGVLGVLRRFLRHIEAARMPLESLRPVVQHRYGAMIDPAIRGADALPSG